MKIKKVIIKLWFLVFIIPLIYIYIYNADKAKSVKVNNVAASYQQENVYQSINTFTEVLFNVQKYYYKEVPIDVLIKYAIDGIFSNLDPYSSYLNADASHTLLNNTRGQFSGVGIQIFQTNNKTTEIAGVIYDTPSYRAGILVGDILLKINNHSISNMDINFISKMLQGNQGSLINLTLKRNNKTYNVTLKREIIKPIVVNGKMYNNIAYIKLNSFNVRANDELIKLINNFKKNYDLKGFILDLRDNPGGLLDQGIVVADNFLSKDKIIVSIVSKNSKEIFYSTKSDILNNLPMIVLINKNSASCAEIVAGALKDNDRAIVIGNTSYGKGLIQSIIPLNNPNEDIRLTTGEYHIPSGISINGNGINPNIYVFGTGNICIQCSQDKLNYYKRVEENDSYSLTGGNNQMEYVDYQLQYALRVINKK